MKTLLLPIMRKPNTLQAGDKIAIVSTARKIDSKDLDFSISLLESWGLNVVLGKSIGVSAHQFAGNDALRAEDFQTMLNRKDIKAILCAKGGYGTIRILDQLDFTQFMLHPKWIIGYSDVTVLHAHINSYLAVQTLHASMPINFKTNTAESLSSIQKVLFGEKLQYQFAPQAENILGKATGKIVGGNLSILYSILGTKSGIHTDDKILFIEDLDEMLYHIDRMLIALKRASKLNKIKALIVGDVDAMRDNTKAFGFATDNPFGKSAKAIILEHCKDLGIPIAFHFPAGHIADNRAIPFGQTAHLAINKNTCTLDFLD